IVLKHNYILEIIIVSSQVEEWGQVPDFHFLITADNECLRVAGISSGPIKWGSGTCPYFPI
ncbi:MAG: hypothetical protein Q4Q30_06430, partial [Eggerthella sp.]|nr:hypothetical protein [Eggerthella sp.]